MTIPLSSLGISIKMQRKFNFVIENKRVQNLLLPLAYIADDDELNGQTNGEKQ